MVLRIRLDRGIPIKRSSGKNRHLALATAALLTPASLMAGALAFWRLAADMQWTSEFAISDGLFSHWLVWLGMAVGLLLTATRLNRYGRGGETTS
ncbi:MAG: hypothetical protein FJW20_01245 [Acidimicrobiia bacterium]|nr:hypothetical protein [Acidimicrobiia bacterium]